MLRRLFNLLAGASLLLAVAFAALGAQSFWRNETLWVDLPPAWDRWMYIESQYGVLFAAQYKNDVIVFRAPNHLQQQTHPFAWRPPTALNWWSHGGFYYYGDPDGHVVGVPYWFLVLITLLLPALWVYRYCRLSEKLAAGKCPQCGYDLRASPERCPECGTVVKRFD